MWWNDLMVSIRPAVLLLCLDICVANPSVQTGVKPVVCEPVEWPVQMLSDSGLKVVRHWITLGVNQDASIVLQNETGKTIARLLVVVNYLDSEGKPIFAIPFLGGVGESPLELLQIRSFIKTVLDHPIRPGETFQLFGTNLESTRVSPARAEVTLVDTESETGGNSVSIGDNATNPLLLRLPDFFQLQADISKLPDELLLTLEIDERGRVSSVQFEQSSKLEENAAQQIRSQLVQWLFFPATRGGWAVQEQLNLLLRFHERGFPLAAPMCPLNLSDKFPRTFVEIDLRRIDDQRWGVMYGGKDAHGRFGTIESHSSPTEVSKDSNTP
jgi:hypothetical protein